MAEIHVRAGAAGAGSSVPTLAAAAAIARPGDTVVLHEGVYRELFRPPAGVTWRAAEGERAAIDGGWKGQRMATADAKINQVLVNQPDVTLIGLEIRNVPGYGIGLTGGAGNFVMKGCEIHHTVNSGYHANGTGTLIRGVTIEDCDLHHLSMSGKWQETPVSGCFLHRYVIGLRVKNTRVRFGYGEGFALGPFTEDADVEVWVEDTVHLGIYASNRAKNVRFRNCVIVQRGLAEWRQGDGDVGAGFVIGDEVAGKKTENWPHGDNIIIEDCLTINAGSGVGVRNNKKMRNGELDGYDTRGGFIVRRCTFIAGPDSKSGVAVAENQFGAKVKGTFRNNLFINDRLPAGGEALKNNAPGVEFIDNLWSGGVPAGLPASNQATTAAALVAPFATVGETVNLDNYRPRAGGPLDGAGYGALPAVGTEPPPPPPDPEPEPTPVDWAALRALAAEVGGELLTAARAVDAAARALQTLDNRMREYELAAEGGEE
jgi:hypothetical protein